MKLHAPGYPAFAVLATPDQGSTTLINVLEAGNEIGLKSLTQTLFRVLLTNPEDDKGDDYCVVQAKDQPLSLVRIDSERSFYPIEEFKRGIWPFSSGKHTLIVKSIIYCMKFMNDPLESEVLSQFLALKIEDVMYAWLDDLAREHETYQRLFTQDELMAHFDENKFEQSGRASWA